MRREGRMHGAYIRESKHSDWFAKAQNKPTNHSKCTSCCLNNRPRCRFCHELPASKSRDKVKGVLKAKAFNITSNYKMQDWRIRDSTSPSSSMKKPILKVEKSFTKWAQYADWSHRQSDDSDCEDDSQNDDEVDGGQEEAPNSWTSEIVLPIESLVRMRKTREALPDDTISDGAEDSANDSDDSWSGVDFSEGDVSDGEESWADDWSLVEEAL